jgi:succinate dehydrogenase/fumarate reductase flavoprotein subunit
MQALLKATPDGLPATAWLLADHDFVRRYGLGAVKPAPMPLGAHVRSGYLKRADTLQALAQSCGLNPEVLSQTVARYNAMALSGTDHDFAKGATPYNRVQGDGTRRLSNPCMAPMQQGPYYAVQVVQGSLGTFAGLKVSPQGQVLDAQSQPIVGLYASGNDMSSMMGGNYPSVGSTCRWQNHPA